MQQVAAEEQQELRAEQIASKENFQLSQEETVNPFAAKFSARQKDIKTVKTRIQKMLESGEKSARLLPIEQIKDTANQFQRRNPELKANVLTLLREYIKPDDSKEELLKKILEFYADVSLADEALEFLIETSDGELARKLIEIKEELQQTAGREITAGRNISVQARQASEKGLGTPTALRDMYRDITGNPRDSTTLFDELSTRYAFKDLKKVVDFLLHALGDDLKAQGSSIEKGMLHRLLTETRSLQAILGIYRFFKGRMGLMATLFGQNGLDMPPELNFEQMSKQFMSLCSERYPNADKVKERAVRLGIERWIIAKIIALTQFRDAIREVALHKIYRSLQHRDELYLAIIEALEDLEDELEELEEREGRGKGEEEEEDEEEDEEDNKTKIG
jgi:type III secretion protein W